MRKPLSSAYNRDISRRKAERKKRISDNFFYDGRSWYPYLGYYRKGKIHCSCGMCTHKTRNKGSRRLIHGNYAPSINYKHSDMIRQMKMDESEREYYSSCNF